MTNVNNKPTEIVVFEYRGSGQAKIQGIKRYGNNIKITKVINLEKILPDFIDNPEDYIEDNFEGDLVLSFIKHPDLLHYLALICQRKEIPLIASGTKCENAITPFTCCGLGLQKGLGDYGRQFGLPEFKVTIDNNIVTSVTVNRGASCGATWAAVNKIINMPTEKAIPTLAREVQYLCVADPSAFDPISGKSSLHYAGHVHIAALKKAIDSTKD